jgi:hypothetical protein
MKEGLPGGTLRVSSEKRPEEALVNMLHAGLDLSRERIDYCLLAEGGERVEVGVAPPDGDGLVGLARRVEVSTGRSWCARRSSR